VSETIWIATGGNKKSRCQEPVGKSGQGTIDCGKKMRGRFNFSDEWTLDLILLNCMIKKC
jgi:hypothetical protein